MGDDIQQNQNMSSAESVRVQFATLDMVNAVDKKVDDMRKDVSQMKGWLEGDVSPLGVQRPGVLLKVEQSARDLRSAKNWLRAIFVAICAAVITQWVLHFAGVNF